MKRYYVSIPVEYVIGYLRSGHFEGYVEANSEAEAKLKLQINSIEKYLDFYVDDYSVEDIGDILENEIIIEEMPDGTQM